MQPDHRSSDFARIYDMMEAMRTALEFIRGESEDDFLADRMCQNAVVRQLTILGEAAKHVSQDTRDEYAAIPWRSIAGFRDIAVHQYSVLDPARVWIILRDHLPQDIVLLEPLLHDESEEPDR